MFYDRATDWSAGSIMALTRRCQQSDETVASILSLAVCNERSQGFPLLVGFNVDVHEHLKIMEIKQVQRRIDLYTVQRLLGHKTGTMTQRYAHHSPESLRDGVTVLGHRPPHDTTLSQLGGSLKAGSSKSLTEW